MGKKIKMSLSKSSIDDAIRQVQDYKNMLDINISLFLDLLMGQGLNIGRAILQSIPQSEYKGKCEVDFDPIEGKDGEFAARIYLSGSQALFIEFSAGEKFGTNSFQSLPNNSSYGSGYGKGTYPGAGHWNDPDGWWFKDESGQWVNSFGTEAHAPMYWSDQMMRQMLVRDAKYVFGGK